MRRGLVSVLSLRSPWSQGRKAGSGVILDRGGRESALKVLQLVLLPETHEYFTLNQPSGTKVLRLRQSHRGHIGFEMGEIARAGDTDDLPRS